MNNEWFSNNLQTKKNVAPPLESYYIIPPHKYTQLSNMGKWQMYSSEEALLTFS